MIAFKKTNFVLVVIIALLSFFLVQQCSKKNMIKEMSKNQIKAINDTLTIYKNENGQLVAQKRALEVSKKNLEDLIATSEDKPLEKLAEGFKDVDAAVSITNRVVYDTVTVSYVDTIPYKFEKKWTKNSKYYSLSGLSTNEGVKIYNFTAIDTLSIVVGEKKTGLFSSEYRVEAVHSNPHILTRDLNAYVLKTNEGIINIEGQVGYGLTVYGATPYVGVGVGLDLGALIKKVF